ncbi:unnamed protein product, partial [Closterium sp. NIES-54]
HHRTDTAAQLLQTGAPPSAVLVAAAKSASIAAAAAATGEEGRRGAGMWGAMERKERQERMRLAAEAVAADEAVVEAYTALLPRDLQARISSDPDAQGRLSLQQVLMSDKQPGPLLQNPPAEAAQRKMLPMLQKSAD